MKLLLFYSCLLAILFQAVSASLSLDGSGATLTSDKPGSKKAKKPVMSGKKKKRLGGKKAAKKPTKIVDGESGKEVGTKSTKQRKSLRAKKRVVGKKLPKEEGVGKGSKDSVAVKKDEPKTLSAILPKVLMEIVIDYVKEDTYFTIVYTHDWPLKSWPTIEVDNVRLYVITSEGIYGLNHSSASLEEDERRYIEFGNSQWLSCLGLISSHDGRHVSFSHVYKSPTDCGKQNTRRMKWLTQGSELEGGKFKPIAFDGEDSSWGLLSRNGRILCSCNSSTNVTRVYRIVEEAEKDPFAVMKFELNGKSLAVSGDGNRIMMANAQKLEIHDIGKDASELVCRIGVDISSCHCALNESGSEAAFFNGDVLRVMEVGRVAGDRVNQPAIVTAEGSGPLIETYRLVYSDDGKLHARHPKGKVSFFDPLTKSLILIEAPQIGQKILDSAISSNADHYATIEYVKEEKSSGKRFYRTTLKRRELTKAEWMSFFQRLGL